MSDSEKELVCILKTFELKEIQEVETIYGENIFYMTDGSSYHETEISNSAEHFVEAFVRRLTNNDNLFLQKIGEIVRADSRNYQ
jgi:hypothetical protein